MRYKSTRGGVDGVPFMDAVMMGLATDGGLLLPESLPDVSGRLQELRDLDFPDLALTLMELYIDDIPRQDLQKIIRSAYGTFADDKVTPLRQLDGFSVLELFHGPTLAFKDVALQFLGNVFDYILKKRGGRLNILGATSGDTGSSAIYGVRGKDNIHIFIMHPKGRTSPVQELQMTTVTDANVHNIAVEGTFDDCQRILKQIFNELDFKQSFHLGAVNSVNWARILAQVVYYFYAWSRATESVQEKVSFSVPTGNFGDIFAGYLAGRMGLPLERLILATNENNILARFFNTGIYERGDVFHTISPSMDIQVASNFERYLYYKLGGDSARLRDMMEAFAAGGRLELPADAGHGVDDLIVAGSGDTAGTLDTIRQIWTEQSYLLDPHTAVGVRVGLEKHQGSGRLICLATAHPAKFPDSIRKALGEDLARHPSLDRLQGLPTRCVTLPAEKQPVMDLIRQTTGG